MSHILQCNFKEVISFALGFICGNSYDAYAIKDHCILSILINLQMDLSPFISKSHCECLNEADDHPFTNCMSNSQTYLESDCDEQVSGIHPSLVKTNLGNNLSNFII